MSLNAKVCETYPEATGAARDAGWEFMAHSYVQMPIQQIADRQREVMDQSIDILKKFTGKKPNGWLGPGRGQMYDTLDHATAAGFTWFGDWVLDDQPIWVKTAKRADPVGALQAEINDITMMVSHHHEFDVLFTRTNDAFDRLYQESKELTRILAIGVHPYVTGQAHRIKYFEQLYATSTSTRAWCTGPASRFSTGTPSRCRRRSSDRNFTSPRPKAGDPVAHSQWLLDTAFAGMTAGGGMRQFGRPS